MIVAMFDAETKLTHALERFRAARVGPVETYTPAPMQNAETGSPIPLIILAMGLLGTATSFALQTYSYVYAYPFEIGGRPNFAWASFIPTAFENGVLAAIVAGFLAFMIINRMPRLYEPVDEAASMRRASRDRWILQVATDDETVLERARALLRDLRPVLVEEVPA
jgi:hypothetical protein